MIAVFSYREIFNEVSWSFKLQMEYNLLDL